jgi:hypothetical protein
MKKLFLPSLLVFIVYYTIIDKPTQNKIEEKIISYTQEDTSVVEESETEVKSTPKKEVSTGGGSIKKGRSPEVTDYFNEVVMNTEFGGPRKTAYTWKKGMLIYVDGEKPEYLMDELKRIVGELNDIINPIELKIVSSPAESNYTIYIGSHVDFKNKYKLLEPQLLERNWGYFELYNNSGVMYIDTYRNGDKTSYKHLLREELTQSLGLFNDSYKYPESIFYQGWTTTTEFAPIDREIIDMLYNN